MTIAEEAALIGKVLSGDLRAYEQLMVAHQPKSLVIAKSMVKDPDDAKDVVQESFINAFRYLHKFDQKSMFSTWLYRIVVNQSLKFLRKQDSAEKLAQDLSFPSSSSVQNLGIQSLEKDERQSEIEGILQQMKPKEALMLQMHYLLELSVKEIEQSTGFTASNIKVLLHRARQNFYAIKNTNDE